MWYLQYSVLWLLPSQYPVAIIYVCVGRPCLEYIARCSTVIHEIAFSPKLETDRQRALHQLSTNRSRIQKEDYSKYIYIITLICHSLEIFFLCNHKYAQLD